MSGHFTTLRSKGLTMLYLYLDDVLQLVVWQVILLFGRRFTISCMASTYLSWCIKRNWPQSILGFMTFWHFMLIPVCRSRKYFFAIYTSAWNSRLAASKNSRHWFGKSNGSKRQTNAMKEYLYSRLQHNVFQFESLQVNTVNVLTSAIIILIKLGNFPRNLDYLFFSCSYSAACP